MRLGWVTLALVATLGLPRVARAGDAKLECISAADKAQSARDDGRYRAARDGFATCARAVCPKVVADSCTKWARELEDAMPTIVLSAKDSRGADVSDVSVTFDGAPLASTLDGKPVEVDPGAHRLRFEHEGSPSIERAVVIKAGEKLREISVTFASSAPVAVASVPETKPSGGSSTLGRTVTTIVLGVVAGGALAGGVAFGLASQGDADTAASLRGGMPSNACTGGATTTACVNLSNAVDAESRDGTLSVVMDVGAGVLAAGAVVAWLLWPKPKEEHGASARILVGPGFAGLGGSF